MTNGYIPNKAACLQEILKNALPVLQNPGDDFGFTMPNEYHIYIYVDNADEKVYVIEPNRVEDGAHEPFTGDTYLATHGNVAELMLGCLWCMDEFERDAQEQAKNQPERVSIPLGFATLVAERGSDPDYKEVFIGLEDKNGNWLQDLAVIGGKYYYENDNIVYENKVSIKVYSDKDIEDYTHDFTVEPYVPELEPTTRICVYKDALSFDDDDNLTYITVPTQWLFNQLRKEGETDFSSWLDTYTADNTDAIARLALAEGVIIDCDEKRIPLTPKKPSLSAQISEAQAKQATPGAQHTQQPTKNPGR